MKKYSQIQKIISALMIFLLLIQLSGCYSTKTISSSTLPLADSIKCSYTVHCHNSKYLLEKVNISNGILSGEIDTTGNSLNMKNSIHIYLSSDSVMKINTGYILSIPLDGIAKVNMVKFDAGLTIFCATICTLGILTLVAIIELNSSGGWGLVLH